MASYAGTLTPVYGMQPAANWITAGSTSLNLRDSALNVQALTTELGAIPFDTSALQDATLAMIENPIPASVIAPAQLQAFAFDPVGLPSVQVYTPPVENIAPIIEYYIPPIDPVTPDFYAPSGLIFPAPLFDPITLRLQLRDGSFIGTEVLPIGPPWSVYTEEQKNSLDANARILLDNLILLETGAVTIPVMFPNGDFGHVITPVNLEPSGGYTLHLPADAIPTGDPMTPGVNIAGVSSGFNFDWLKGKGGKIILAIAGVSGLAYLAKKL